MSSSLWDLSATELLQRASSADPTPGGGAVAAVAAAFGMSLVLMAIEVTLCASESGTGGSVRLASAKSRASELQAGFVEAADRDIAEFEALIAAYRLPQQSEYERAERNRVIDEATVAAALGPLGVAEASVAGIAVAYEIEPSIKSTVISDAQAGRDLLRGAALAALRTADINVVALDQRKHPRAAFLRDRRDVLHRAATGHEDRR